MPPSLRSFQCYISSRVPNVIISFLTLPCTLRAFSPFVCSPAESSKQLQNTRELPPIGSSLALSSASYFSRRLEHDAFLTSLSETQSPRAVPNLSRGAKSATHVRSRYRSRRKRGPQEQREIQYPHADNPAHMDRSHLNPQTETQQERCCISILMIVVPIWRPHSESAEAARGARKEGEVYGFFFTNRVIYADSGGACWSGAGSWGSNGDLDEARNTPWNGLEISI